MLVTRHFVALLLKVVSVLGLLCIMVYLLYSQPYGHLLSTSTPPGGAQLTPKSLEINTAPWFTAEELDYVRYGEGAVPLVHPRDPRYLNFIRSQIARPAMDKPTLVANVNDVNIIFHIIYFERNTWNYNVAYSNCVGLHFLNLNSRAT